MNEREVLFFILGRIGIEDKETNTRTEMISTDTLNTIRRMIREVVFPAQVVVAPKMTEEQKAKFKTQWIDTNPPFIHTT